MAHLIEFPHVDLEVTTYLHLLPYCQQLHSCYWAWDSAELTLLQFTSIEFHSSSWIQQTCFQQLLFELEYVLAQDWFHLCEAFPIRDGTYERRRSVFCRSDGILWKSLCQEAKDRGGRTIIRPASYSKGTEEALAFIGFGLGRRWQFDHHDYKIDLETRRSIESAPSRQDLHLLRPGRKRQHPAPDIEILEGLACPTKGWTGHEDPLSAHVPVSLRGIGLQDIEIAPWNKRQRLDSSPSEQTGINLHQQLELLALGSQREDLQGLEEGSAFLRGSLSFDSEDSWSGNPVRIDPSIRSFETHASGLYGQGFGCYILAP